MEPFEILEQILVEVSRDGEIGQGTGFFISDNEVVTCYHVLKPDRGGLNKTYWIRHGSDIKWKTVEPDNNRCDSRNDYAILTSNENIEFPQDLKFKTWDRISETFRSPGYGFDQEKMSEETKDYTINGKIIGKVWSGGNSSLRRLQLETDVGTVQPGRSGSPVFSLDQNAIIGMMVFQAGQMSQSREMPLAIPIESIDTIVQKHSLSGQIRGDATEQPDNFLPREDDLKAIRADLLVKDCQKTAIPGVSKFGLHGMGGLGKSVLVAALARDEEVRHFFSDGIFWLRLGIDPKITLKQSVLARMLDNKIHSFNDEEDGRAILSSLLADKNCLIILDDVWHAENVKALLSSLGPRSKMLITTRNASIITAIGAKKYELGLLSDIQSSELLSKWSGQDMAELPSEAHEIIRECGNLPLALVICGALAKDGVSWNDLLDALKKAKLEFISHEYGSVMISMKISIDMLPPEAAKCYRELVVFCRDEPIPKAAIINLWAYANEFEERDGRRLLLDLSNKSLIQNIENNGNSCIELHPLQYDFLIASCQNVLNLHEILLDAYKNKTSEANWYTGPDDGYFFQHLPYHLLEAEREADLRDLLLNIKWLQAKLQATDSYELIMDYSLLKSKDDLLLIQEAIRLSAHILARDPGQLKGQLLARLMGFNSRPIQELLRQIPESISGIWLRPMTPSLTTPGGPLIKTVRLHTDSINAIAITPDGQKVVSSSDNTLKVWDLKTGKELQILQGHSESVNAVAITRDGQKVVSGSSDNTLKVWDLETGKGLQILQGHSESVNAVAITRDGRRVVSGSSDNTLKVWDLETGKELQILQGHSKSVNAVAITPDGQKVVSGSGDSILKVWDLETGKELQILQGHSESVSAVAITPDGQKVVSGSGDSTLKIWDLETGRNLQTLKGHTDWIYSVTITSDGQKIISWSDDRTLRVWDLKTSVELQTFQDDIHSVNVVAMSPDDRTAVSGSDDGKLKVWDIEKIQGFSTPRWHNGWVNAVSITPDCMKAVSGSVDYNLKVWDLEKGQELQTLKGHTDCVNALAISPTSNKIISASADTTIKVWDMETGKELHTLRGHENYVNAVAITPDGQKIVSVSGDSSLKVWDLETGKELQTLKGHTNWINAIAITPDGQKAISGSDDGTLKIWDLNLGQEIRTLQSHTGQIRVLALTCNGKLVVSGSIDGILEFWDLETGEELKTVQYRNDSATAIFISSDGKTIVSCSNDDILEVLDMEERKIIAKFIGDDPMISIAVASDRITIVAGDRSGHIHFLRLEDSGHPSE